ncbi:MAG: molybdate ABC transporter substrate-binding protein [Bacteroidia bacterium]|nr:molybdate ABC transporter substrate-binding protein [Bacteroidia bacterium]
MNITKRKLTAYIGSYFALGFFLALIFVSSCARRNSETDNSPAESDRNMGHITVYSAVSLTEVMFELAEIFEHDHGIKVKLNLASSGTLARQIEQGGSPDIFISANRKWWNHIDKSGLTSDDLKTTIGNNALVLISHDEMDSGISLQQALEDFENVKNKRLVIGDPAHVPAGIYAKQALENIGYFIELKKNILKVKDVRAALMLVELKEADYGIVYRTDALRSERVTIVGTFPANSHDKIVYYAGVINDVAAARLFFNFLRSEKAISVWENNGFM